MLNDMCIFVCMNVIFVCNNVIIDGIILLEYNI